MKIPPVKFKDLNNKLIEAARRGKLAFVKKLLDDGADVNATNYIGQTALMLAAANRHVDVVKLLLEHGADVNATDDIGRTALMLAVADQNIEVAKLLLEYDADVDATEINGLTALIVVAGFGHAEIVKLLLEYGADVGVRDGTGQTALMKAVNYGHLEVVNILNNYPVFLQSCGYFAKGSLKLNPNLNFDEESVVILRKLFEQCGDDQDKLSDASKRVMDEVTSQIEKRYDATMQNTGLYKALNNIIAQYDTTPISLSEDLLREASLLTNLSNPSSNPQAFFQIECKEACCTGKPEIPRP